MKAKPIYSIRDARERLVEVASSVEDLRTFFDHFEGVMSQFKALSGEPVVARPIGKAGVAEIPLTDRILMILESASTAMMPKDVQEDYERRGWPKPEKGKLYDAITGAMGYLTKKKKKLSRIDEGYVIAQPNLPTTAGSPSKPVTIDDF